MQVPWRCTGQIAAQIRQGHERVAQQPQALSNQVDQPLVLLTALMVVVVVCGGSSAQDLTVALQEGLKTALQALQLLEHLHMLCRGRVVGCICLWRRCWACWSWASRGKLWSLSWGTVLHLL